MNQQAEIERLREIMREAFDFWCMYCSLSESSQDDIADEKNAMLEKMLAAGRLTVSVEVKP